MVANCRSGRVGSASMKAAASSTSACTAASAAAISSNSSTRAYVNRRLNNGVMPALSNPRHGTFRRNVAAGMSGAEALRQAGGGGATAANGAYRLQRRPEVKARIEEPKQVIAEQAQATITERAAVAEVRSRPRSTSASARWKSASSRPASVC